MQKKTSQHSRKPLVCVFIALLFLVGPVMAAGSAASETTAGIEKIKDLFFALGELFSWFWIVLANISGKLMTNTFVYGEFMGLDTFLWKAWQIMRTFANYAIGFLFAYAIFKYILFPSSKGSTPMSMVRELLVASVLVQASWFLVMVIIDISTIALATISSLPSQVIANNSYTQKVFIDQVKSNILLGSATKQNPEAVKINPFVDVFNKTSKQLGIEFVPLTQIIEEKQLLDDLLPKPGSLAGPLTYLGFSVFKTHNFLKEYSISDADTVEQLTKMVISLLLDAGVILLFSFALLVLIIVLIFRLVYLWIFIVASPIILLMAVTKTIDLGKVSDFLDFKKILNLIFKPVVFALWISIMFLVVIAMQGLFSLGSGNFDNAVHIKETVYPVKESNVALYTSEMEIGKVVKVSLYQGTKSLKDIMLGLLTLAMMRYLVKLAITSKTGTTLDKITKPIIDIAEKGIGSIGIVPTPTGAIGLNQVRKNGESPLVTTAFNTYDSALQGKEQEEHRQLSALFGIKGTFGSLTKLQQSKLASAAQDMKPTTFPSLLATYKQENGGIRFSEIKQHLPTWISQNRGKPELKNYLSSQFKRNDALTDPKKQEEALSDLFKNATVFTTFYRQVLGGEKTGMTYEKLNTTEGDIVNES